MAYKFAKTCEFLLNDAPLAKPTKGKYGFPPNNHLAICNYAKVADVLVNFSSTNLEAKPIGLVYHKLVSHTFKHILHKYKRFTKAHQYQVWSIVDFYTYEAKYFTYSDYPTIEDLCALKKEIVKWTSMKIDPFDNNFDKALDSLSFGALSDLELYSMENFKKDFDLIQPIWQELIEELRERAQEPHKQITQGEFKLITK